MKLPKLEDLDVQDKKVIVRGDFDVDFGKLKAQSSKLKGDLLRLESMLPTLKYLLERKAAKIILLGHRGRPSFAKATEGKPAEQEIKELSLEPLVNYFSEKLKEQVCFVPYNLLSKLNDGSLDAPEKRIILVENIRFWPEEEENKDEFAQFLARCADFYVNECFSTSHREHMSFVGLPKYLPHAAGFHFVAEVENLSKVRESPKRPVVVIIGGAKEDKLSYIEDFLKFADKILLGGRLPEYLEKTPSDKIIVASLNQDKEDITIASIEAFEKEIKKAGTVVVAGPMGKFEDKGQRLGTERVLKAAGESAAFKVAGGGDTEKAISLFELRDKFDWLSVGGGATLEFLVKGTLPGIEALI